LAIVLQEINAALHHGSSYSTLVILRRYGEHRMFSFNSKNFASDAHKTAILFWGKSPSWQPEAL
jgi:hypothetical protein